MSTILHEGSFLTANLRDILNKASATPNGSGTPEQTPTKSDAVDNSKPAATADTTTDTTSNNQGQETTTKITDWGKELEDRLSKNQQLSQESRKKPIEIKQEFWQEYFTAVFGANLVNNLRRIGSLLTEDISNKAWGGFSSKNPVVAFLSTKYVKENLIATGLLNKSTYTAIHQAIVKKLMPDSEYKNCSKNTYNIIYCKDLYTKSADEMLKYLTLQNQHLKNNNGVFTVQMQEANKRIFLVLSRNTETNTDARAKKQVSIEYAKLPSTKDSGAKLNPIDLIVKILSITNSGITLDRPKKIINKDSANSAANTDAQARTGQSSTNHSSGNAGNTSNSSSASSNSSQGDRVESNNLEKLNDLVDHIDNIGEAFAVLQYASMNSNSIEINKLLANKKFDSLDKEKIRAGAAGMAPYTKGLKLSTAEAVALARMISNKKVKK